MSELPTTTNESPHELHEAGLLPPEELAATWRSIPVDSAAPGEACGSFQIYIAGAEHKKFTDNTLFASVNVTDPHNGVKPLIIDGVKIDDTYRNRGVGSQLYRAVTRLALEKGVTHLLGDTPREAALLVRRRLFELARIAFYDKEQEVQEHYTLATQLTDAEGWARAAACEARSAYMDMLNQKYGPGWVKNNATEAELAQLQLLRERRKGFVVAIDLRGLDTSDWEPTVVAETP